MTRAWLLSVTALVATLSFGASVQAQAAQFTTTNCSHDDETTIRKAMEGALARLSKIEQTSPSLFRSVYDQAFGTAGQADYTLAFELYYVNVRQVLTAGVHIGPSGVGDPFPVLNFTCSTLDPSSIAVKNGAGGIILYKAFFQQIAFEAQYDTADGTVGTQVSTMLHESIHQIGAGHDLELDGANQVVTAENLALAKDPRALGNAQNYEKFFMTFRF